MFNPAKSDLINDEMDVSDISQPHNVVELHPRSIDESRSMSDDITPEKQTVGEFCQSHGITNDDFVAARRKAARKHPDLDFKPIREGSRTYWVKHPEIIAQYIELPTNKAKSVQTQAIDGEIVQDCVDGSKLVKHVQRFEVPLLPLETPRTREFIEIDVSPIQRLSASLRADQEASKEVEKITRLARIADEALIEKEQEDLIRLLIKQGYTKEQAIAIASGTPKH